MELSEFIGVIRKWKWLILPIVMLTTGLTIFTSLRSQESYRAETLVVIGLSKITTSSAEALNLSQSGKQIGATYAELMTVQDVMRKALEKAGLDWQPEDLSGRVAVDLPPNTSIMKISVTDTDLDRAMILTNAVSEAFIEYIVEVSNVGIESTKESIQFEIATIETALAALPNDGSASVAAQSSALQLRRETAIREYEQLLEQKSRVVDLEIISPSSSYSVVKPNLVQRTLVAFGISVIVAIALAFLAEAFQKAVRPEVKAAGVVFEQAAQESSGIVPVKKE